MQLITPEIITDKEVIPFIASGFEALLYVATGLARVIYVAGIEGLNFIEEGNVEIDVKQVSTYETEGGNLRLHFDITAVLKAVEGSSDVTVA